MMNKESIEETIEKRKDFPRKQKSIRILNEYLSFLTDEDKRPDLSSFIEELLKYAALECYFGNEIYSVDDIGEFLDYHKKIIDKEFRKIVLSSRAGFSPSRFYRLRNKVWDTMDISFDILRTHEFESMDVFQHWLDDSMDYLIGTRRDLKSKAYKLSLKRLQLTVETLIKSYALYTGLKKEEQLYTTVGHLPIKVYIDLLKESWVVKAKDIFKLKGDMNEHIEILEKYKPPRVKSKNLTDADIKILRDAAKEWDRTTDFFIKKFKKIDKKMDKEFSKKGTAYLVNYCKRKTKADIKAYHKAWFGFSALLLPLSIITQFYSSKYTYADYSRELNIDYKNTNLVKNLKEITHLLEENINFLRNSFNENLTFSYMLLCETLGYKLEHIADYQSREEKLKTICESIDGIKNNQYVTKLIDKIKNNDVINNVEIYFHTFTDFTKTA